MTSAAHLRSYIEGALARKVPSALTPASRVVRPLSPTGLAEVDELLEGGLPAGAISEFTGPACSGKVSLALAFVAARTLEGQVCAWIDASDGFDPASAQAAGVELERLLWVRCGEAGHEQLPHVTAGSRFAVQATPATTKTCIGMHPRMEEHGMATALEGLLQARDSTRMSGKPGTPGAVNRTLGATLGAQPRVEQIASDRLPARRGEHALDQKSKLAAGHNGVVSLASHADDLASIAPRCAETQQGFARAQQARVVAVEPLQPAKTQPKSSSKSPWDRLDQAIRTTDLLLQAGGFSCIVLDLSGMEAELANRIPLATWFRFRAAADRTRTALVVLSQHASTGSSGEILLRLKAREPEGTTVMTHIPLHVELARRRFAPQPAHPVQQGNIVTMRKPPRSATTADLATPCASLKAAGVAR